MRPPRSGGRAPAPQRGHSRVGQGLRPGALALLLAACGGGDSAVPAASGTNQADAEAAALAEPAAGQVDPAAQLDEVQQGAAEDVVRLLLQWDTTGLRYEAPWADALAQLYCFIPEEQCRSDEPVYEFAVIVEGYTLDPVFLGEDSAQFVVIFDEVGALWPDRTADPLGTAPETLSLKRMAGRWRLVGPDAPMPEHLSRNGVLRRFRGVQPDSVVIERWLRERAQGSER